MSEKMKAEPLSERLTKLRDHIASLDSGSGDASLLTDALDALKALAHSNPTPTSAVETKDSDYECTACKRPWHHNMQLTCPRYPDCDPKLMTPTSTEVEELPDPELRRAMEILCRHVLDIDLTISQHREMARAVENWFRNKGYRKSAPPSPKTSPELSRLLKESADSVRAMSPQEYATMIEAQKKSWAYGQQLDNDTDFAKPVLSAPDAMQEKASNLYTDDPRLSEQIVREDRDAWPDYQKVPAPTGAMEAAKAFAQHIADELVQRLMELPDRTSPDDWPEACLVTGKEMEDMVLTSMLDDDDLATLLTAREAAVREACAKVAEEWRDGNPNANAGVAWTARKIAAAIRAGGQSNG